jgi:hypothetical protein
MADVAGDEIDVRLDAEIVADPNSGWACVVVPDSKERLGTGKAVRIVGTVDGEEIEATMLPIGGGRHMVPIKAAVRRTIGKGIGDRVHVEITGRR